MAPDRIILIALTSALAVSWLCKSNDGFKFSLAATALYLAWLCFRGAMFALSSMDSAIERRPLPGQWLKRIFPVCLLLAASVFWLSDRRDGSLISGMILGLYYVCIGLRKMETAVNGFKRRRELDRMPLFSLRGKTLCMTGSAAAIQEKPLDALDRVLIFTTDQGPFVCDSFLRLEFHDGPAWIVAMENPCYQSFYDTLREVLPLNDEQALLAAFSVGTMIFPLWERADGNAPDEDQRM